jgi:chloride channel protein, CIC family
MRVRAFWYRIESRLSRIGDTLARYLSQLNPNALMLALATVVGICAGFASVGFARLLDFSHELFFEQLEWLHVGSAWSGWLLPIIPAVGGLIVGPLIYHFAKEAKGHGVPEVMDAVASKGGRMRGRVVIVKAVASAITIGSGGSAGQEGPIVQIGAALGSKFGKAFDLSADRLKVLVGCGAAAGISAIFNAPIAGVLFALEIILGDFRIQTFSPVVISAVLASVVAQSFLGSDPAFEVPDYELIAPWELGNYLVLGAIAGAAAVAFVKTLYSFEDFFDNRLRIPEWLKPMVGGLLVGLLGMINGGVLGGGYRPIGAALHGEMAVLTLVALVFLKPLATSLTLGSGGSGGVFAPSLFLGAMIGGLFGRGVETVFPQLIADSGTLSGAYALVGMGALVAASTHAWMTSVVIVFEMTDNYSIILPLMLATVVSTVVARSLTRESVYTEKLVRSGRHVERGLDLALLGTLRVSDAMFANYVYLSPGATMTEIVSTARRARSYDFPVVASGGSLVGMISLPDVAASCDTDVPELLVAADLASSNYTPLFPDETLDSAMRKFDFYDRPTLPVVDRDEPSRIVAMLDRRQILNLHERVSLLGHPDDERRTEA